MKKRIAHNGDTSISNMASENVINARPGPEPTCKIKNHVKLYYTLLYLNTISNYTDLRGWDPRAVLSVSEDGEHDNASK